MVPTRSTRLETDLVFVLCTPRSGSTLLSRLLGSYPGVIAPAETNLAGALQQVFACVGTLRGELGFPPMTDSGSSEMAATKAATSASRHILEDCLKDLGSPRLLCDKSLTNAAHAEFLLRVFPNARFICLFRHCLDVVCSLIEACPWGFNSFGATPYVARWPGNFVAGLTELWLQTTQQQLQFSAAHPDVVRAITYEALVEDTDRAVGSLATWLSLDDGNRTTKDPVVKHVPAQLPSGKAAGPADYKINFTSVVDTSSVGRGHSVPLSMLPPGLLETLNGVLTQIGYPAIDEAWNRRPSSGRRSCLTASRAAGLTIMVDLLQKRLGNHKSGQVGLPSDSDSITLGLEDLGLTLNVDLAQNIIDLSEGIADSTYLGSSADVLAVVLGYANLGTVLRRGGLRLSREELIQSPQAEALLALLVPEPEELAPLMSCPDLRWSQTRTA
jgi:protein-tyrosine sulfotransferase